MTNYQLPITNYQLPVTSYPPTVGWHGQAQRRRAAAMAAIALTTLSGCVQPVGSPRAGPEPLDRRAVECLKAAVRYPHNPAVRVQAIEALQNVPGTTAGPWIRSALLDEHPAVRFAACLAVGERRDSAAESGIAQCLNDPDPSVRVGALFARHRLGHTERTGELAGYVLTHEDVAVRRNAALVLGLLGEPGAIKVLAKAMRDSDRGVRHHALEAMARLGNREARQELTFMTNSGVGSEEVFAIAALSATRDLMYVDTFRLKLSAPTHVETRLAAGRALGLLGIDDAYDLSISSLRSPRPVRGDAGDPPQGQILRVQQLAAASLGAIGRPAALPALEQVLSSSSDPRVQVSAARAVVDIVAARKPPAPSLASVAPPRKGS